ncbi:MULTISPECIES: hypothetical protein [Microbacterium]|uniref:hypothetical protein n=1 Tax=Microbacterium TaxID=33882 RepID=UPI0027D8BF4C|nr:MULTISPECIES: hypothetical protein [Microbacterium]MDR6098933.1 hypothetical protein [Microbacterium sp. SORGH_AS_0454]
MTRSAALRSLEQPLRDASDTGVRLVASLTPGTPEHGLAAEMLARVNLAMQSLDEAHVKLAKLDDPNYTGR